MSDTSAAAAAQDEPGTDPAEEAPEVRPYSAVLHDLEHGAVHDELSKELAELVKAVVSQGKAGTLSVTLKVSPSELGSEAVTVVGEIKSKAPQPPRAKTVLYAGDDGQLTRRNPRQMAFDDRPLREAPKPAEARDIRKEQ